MKMRNLRPFVLWLTVLFPVAAFGQDATWTDTTGKFRVQATFLRLENDRVHLRKTDGREIAVPLAQLDAGSKEQARRLHRQQASQQAASLPAASANGSPPKLPPMPTGLAWKKEDKKTVDSAVANYEHDQVTAHLTFRKFLDRKKNGPNQKQKEWLERAASACRSRAIAVVTADFARAIDTGDIRNALVASIVSKKVHPTGLGDKVPSLAVLKSRLFSTNPPAQSVWKLEDVEATELKGAYSEGFASNKITLTPKKGFRLVRVTGKATNLGNGSDLPYINSAFGGIKEALAGGISANVAAADKPRLAMDEFIYLVTAGGDWIACGHVCEGSTTLRGMTLTIQGVGMIALGGYVSQNKSFEMDILFTVPQGINEAKLLLLGANPLSLKITR